MGAGHVDYRGIALNVIARDRVLYHGHAVAAVAATSLEVALTSYLASRGRRR